MKMAVACVLMMAIVILVGPRLDACPNTASAESAAGPVPSANTASNVGLADVSGLITGVGGGGMGPLTVSQGAGAGAAGAGGPSGTGGSDCAFMSANGVAVGSVAPDGSGGFTITPFAPNPVVFSQGTFVVAGNAPRFMGPAPAPAGTVSVAPGGTLHLLSGAGTTFTTSVASGAVPTGVVAIDFKNFTGGATGATNMSGGAPGAFGAVSGINVPPGNDLPDANQSYLEGIGSAQP